MPRKEEKEQGRREADALVLCIDKQSWMSSEQSVSIRSGKKDLLTLLS